MYRAYFLVIMLLLNSFVGAQEAVTKEQCRDELEKVFKGLPSETILSYVKLQTTLTTHRLAWAHLQHLKQKRQKENKPLLLNRDIDGNTTDTFEKSMKALIENEMNQKIESDIDELVRVKRQKELEQATKHFNEYAKNLDANSHRRTLAAMSPTLRTAINKQLEDKGSPSIYKVNASDLAILHLLAKGESERSDARVKGKDGQYKDYSYQHKQGRRGVGSNLNIARMVNSSMYAYVRGQDGKIVYGQDGKEKQFTSNSIENNLAVFKRVIESKEKELNDLVMGMLKENQPACFNQKIFCSVNPIPDLNIASFLLGSDELVSMLNNEIETRSKDADFKQSLIDALDYCENWLHTDAQCLDPQFRDHFCKNCSDKECSEPKKKKEKEAKVIANPEDVKVAEPKVPNGDLPKIVPVPKVDEFCPDGTKKTPGIECDGDPEIVETCPDGTTKPPGVECNGNPEIVDDKITCPNGLVVLAKNKQFCDPKKNENIDINQSNVNNVINNIYIGMNNTSPISMPTEIMFVTPEQAAQMIYAQIAQGQNPNQFTPNYPNLPYTPGFNGGYSNGNDGGYNMNGNTIPGNGGNGSGGGNNKDGDGKDKTPKKWGISMTSKVDQKINSAGEDLLTTLIGGKIKKGMKLCAIWKYPSDLSELNREVEINGGLIKVAATVGAQPLSTYYAPYQNEAYKVKVTLTDCDKKKIDSATVEIKRAWEGGSFSCNYNPANWGLEVCQPFPDNSVHPTPYILQGTDFNHSF